MATIPVQGTELRHVRKTITFDGSANNGNLGDSVPVFTLTGRVGVAYMAAYWTTGPTCSAPSVTSISLSPNLIAATTLDNEGTDIWWLGGDGNADSSPIDPTRGGSTFKAVGIGSNVTLDVTDDGGGADITGGVLEIDFWYFPITDNGALAGDDIDESWRDHFWGKAMTELSAVPAITASAFDAVRWLFTLARNKITQTSSTQTLRNDADNASIATSSVSDDGTTFTRAEWS